MTKAKEILPDECPQNPELGQEWHEEGRCVTCGGEKDELDAALEDIDAYLETMPPKTDDWSIGYRAITPYVKSLRLLRGLFEVRVLTPDEAAVARIAASRFKKDIERLGYADPEMQKALDSLRVKLARYPNAAKSTPVVI